MNTRTFITAFIMTLTGLTNTAQASFSLPPISFECQSTSPDNQIEVRGTFQEAVNRHGAGEINFTVTAPGLNLKRTGDGQTWTAGEISCSDNELELELEDANYYAGNISNLKMNGHSESMVCQFTSPPSPSTICDQWWCHHNNH